MLHHTDARTPIADPSQIPAIDEALLEAVTGGCAACGTPGLHSPDPADDLRDPRRPGLPTR